MRAAAAAQPGGYWALSFPLPASQPIDPIAGSAPVRLSQVITYASVSRASSDLFDASGLVGGRSAGALVELVRAGIQAAVLE